MNFGPDDTARPTLRELLTRHLPSLEEFVSCQFHRTLRDHESVADVVGSVCGDLLAEGVPFEYRGEAEFHGWLRAVVVNKIRGRLRFRSAKKRRRDNVEPATPSEVEGLVVLFALVRIHPVEIDAIVLRMGEILDDVTSVSLRALGGRREDEEIGAAGMEGAGTNLTNIDRKYLPTPCRGE